MRSPDIEGEATALPERSAAVQGFVQDSVEGSAGGSLSGRRIVLLGGTGFVGGHLNGVLLSRGAEVLLVSPSARPAPGGPGTPRSETLDLLAAPPEEFADLVASFDADVVVNAAGRAWGVSEAAMHGGNAELVSRLCDAVALVGSGPLLVQLGSVHEYGPGTPGTPIPEDREPAPVTEYGRSKLAGTNAVLNAARAGRLNAVVLRVANVLGPGQPAQSLFGKVLRHLEEAADAHARGAEARALELAPLRSHRDLVDVADVCEAVCATVLAPRETVAGRVLNIGGGRPVAMRDLVERMIGLSPVPVRLTEVQGRGGAAPAGQDWQQLDISRAGRLLGWRPRCSLDESLRDMLATATSS